MKHALYFGTLWTLLVGVSLAVVHITEPMRAARDAEIMARKSEQRMQAAVPPRITLVNRKCSLEASQRIWQYISHENVDFRAEPGLLVPFANFTAYYDGKQWWCSEGKR